MQLIRLLFIKIKEEPIDEEYNQNLPSSISTEDIKDEPNVAKLGHMVCFIGEGSMYFMSTSS